MCGYEAETLKARLPAAKAVLDSISQAAEPFHTVLHGTKSLIYQEIQHFVNTVESGLLVEFLKNGSLLNRFAVPFHLLTPEEKKLMFRMCPPNSTIDTSLQDLMKRPTPKGYLSEKWLSPFIALATAFEQFDATPELGGPGVRYEVSCLIVSNDLEAHNVAVDVPELVLHVYNEYSKKILPFRHVVAFKASEVKQYFKNALWRIQTYIQGTACTLRRIWSHNYWCTLPRSMFFFLLAINNQLAYLLTGSPNTMSRKNYLCDVVLCTKIFSNSVDLCHPFSLKEFVQVKAGLFRGMHCVKLAEMQKRVKTHSQPNDFSNMTDYKMASLLPCCSGTQSKVQTLKFAYMPLMQPIDFNKSSFADLFMEVQGLYCPPHVMFAFHSVSDPKGRMAANFGAGWRIVAKPPPKEVYQKPMALPARAPDEQVRLHHVTPSPSSADLEQLALQTLKDIGKEITYFFLGKRLLPTKVAMAPLVTRNAEFADFFQQHAKEDDFLFIFQQDIWKESGMKFGGRVCQNLAQPERFPSFMHLLQYLLFMDETPWKNSLSVTNFRIEFQKLSLSLSNGDHPAWLSAMIHVIKTNLTAPYCFPCCTSTNKCAKDRTPWIFFRCD